MLSGGTKTTVKNPNSFSVVDNSVKQGGEVGEQAAVYCRIQVRGKNMSNPGSPKKSAEVGIFSQPHFHTFTISYFHTFTLSNCHNFALSHFHTLTL